MKKLLSAIILSISLFSCGSLFEGISMYSNCTPDGLWYYYDSPNSGPYHIRISGKTGTYEKIGNGSNADLAIKAGVISRSDIAIKNIKKKGTNNGNPEYSSEFLTFNKSQNGNVVSSFYDPFIMEVQTLNTSLEPCNMLMMTDSNGYVLFVEKIE